MTDMTDDEALETLFAMANVQDGYAKKATDRGLKIIHKANAKAQREVAATIKDLRARLASAEAERDRLAADAQAAVAEIVRSVWGRCEALEDEAADKLAQLDEKLTDHEKGFWRGQKTVSKSIRRSTEMPTAEAIAIRRAEGGKA